MSQHLTQTLVNIRVRRRVGNAWPSTLASQHHVPQPALSTVASQPGLRFREVNLPLGS